MADLAYLDDAAPVKKRRFVQVCQTARAETFTPRTLRAGWLAAGLFPWNPNKAINSSQLHQILVTPIDTISPTPPTTHKTPSYPPSTPKRRRTIDDTILLQTPRHPHDIHYAVQMLGSLTRDQ